VADACSGLRFFIPMILIGLLAGHFFTRGIWRRSVLLLLVAPLSILINVLRIFVSGMFVARGYEEPVTNIFHDLSGWIVFMFAALVLSLAAYLLGKIGTSPGPQKKALFDQGCKSVNLRVGIDFTVALCVIFIISGIALTQPDAVGRSPKRQSFDTFPMKIGQWEGTRAYLSEEVLRSLWADDYVCASFKKKGSDDIIHVFIPYYNYQQTQHTAHAPQSCLLGGGWTLISSYLYPINVQNGKINVMVMSLEKGDQLMLGSYFFLGRSRVVTSPFKNKFYLLLDTLTKKRSDGALIRVELIPSDNGHLTNANTELASFISQLWPVLHTYVPD
jgi:exosortase D (VPLPA-CTERM-specific)